MTSSPLCSTERMESRIGLLMAQSEKQALFAAAAKHNVTASDFVRAAVATLAAADEDDRRQMIAKALVR